MRTPMYYSAIISCNLFFIFIKVMSGKGDSYIL